jgi:hypothetical protein
MRAYRVLSVLVSSLVVVTAFPQRAAAQSPTEVVLQWSGILQTSLSVPGAIPPSVFFPRPYAMLHVAMFDALNSIDYRYREQIVRVRATDSASREVAVAQAAHDVMVSMIPSQAATFEAALAATLARFSGEARAEGVRIGSEAAAACLENRRFDGWNVPPQTYVLADLPGNWQPTPPANAPAALVHYQDVTPFVVSSRLRFMPEAPPALTSERYAQDFNEVKRLGGMGSTERTAEQTQTARLWASVGFSTTAPAVWFNVGRDLALARGWDGVDTARALALLGMAIHDALLTSFSSKFMYGLWRPTTAIREAARDGNAATEPNATFVSLIGTPPYPSYPGNMACIGASSAAVFERVWGGDSASMTVTWTGINQSNVTRTYNGFRQLADEQAISRIYAGIHFKFDHDASFGACGALGEYVYENALRPLF